MATYLLYRPKVYLGSWELVGSACQPCTCKRQRVRFAKLIQYETRPQNNVSKKFLRKTTTCSRLAQDLSPLAQDLVQGAKIMAAKLLPRILGKILARFGHLAQLRNNLPKTCHLLPKTLSKVPRLWWPNSCPGSWARSWARFGHLAQMRNNFLLGINALPYHLRTTNKTTIKKV